ncbi:HrpD5 family protein [Trinickia dinghuensis]|uniref:Uncharacterized protein n=1 Tax=Trinickia dinghuensis TaxID=2291023 RepID=A0A3D8K4T3_9BURK|nr:HrpD5 family protein [Trinickia dinghuensis]RDV00444.1 hypothetical protein DWV00_01240 [Trinickia dinghuensis]
MTKEIRLLTGRHAGARIKLNPTLTRIGNDDEAEIQISDWDQPTMQLSLHDDGSLTIADAAHHGESIALESFKPHRFGNVVLCAGDSDAQWPTDIELLEALLVPAAMPQPEPVPGLVAADEASPAATPPSAAPRHRRGARVVGVAAVALLAIGGAGIALPAVLHPRVGISPHGAAPQPTVDQLQRALDRLHQADVTVAPEGMRFDVVGVVPDSASEMLVRTALETIAPDRIVWRIGCVDQITRDLQESLHDPALKVHYLGHREFGVSGIAKDTNAVQATLQQMSADLEPMVTRVAQQVTPDDRMAMPSAVESLLAVDDLQYVEAGDGTKQFIDSRAAAQQLN